MRLNAPKTGILLLNMGGPDRLADVQPFLYNLFSDPDLIRLPLSILFQKPLAWLISTLRSREAQANYARMGGASPQLAMTRAQAAALSGHLRREGWHFSVSIAMRYWPPETAAALDQLEADGIDRLVVVTLYPHFSYTTTGSSLKALRRELARRGLTRDRLPLSILAGYCRAEGYLAALAGCIREGLETHDWGDASSRVQVLFSAHSLPAHQVKRTRDPYPIHIRRCAETLMERFFPGHEWDIAYQSKVGRMPWLGPDVEGVLHYYAGKSVDNVLIVPLSFVSDHVETLVEIDQLYLPLAAELGISHCHRAPVMNTRPAFIEALAGLICEKAERRWGGLTPVLEQQL